MSHSIADDYAVLNAGRYEFYYGYERTSCERHTGEGCENCEWAFVASHKGDELMRVGSSKLGVRRGSDMGEFLLAGIGQFIARFVPDRLDAFQEIMAK